jgi:hypothetical protein
VPQIPGMRLLGIILATSLVLAALRLALAVLIVGCLAGIIAGVLVRPRETLGLLLVLAVASLIKI